MHAQGYSGRPHNGYVLALILGAHAAALTALALAKPDLFERVPDRPLITENVPLDPPPPPDEITPPERKTAAEPRTPSVIDTVKPPIPIPSDGPIITSRPMDDVAPPYFPPGGTTLFPDPPPIPQPEPAPPPKITSKLKPRGNPASWVTNDDYPAAALRAEEQGRTAFSLIVGADGKPSACTVTASSGSAALDGAACRLLMRRARFVPGSDGDGNPTGGTYRNSFSWQIPED